MTNKDIIKKIIRLEQRTIKLFEGELLPMEMNEDNKNIQRSYIDLIRSMDYLDKYLEMKK